MRICEHNFRKRAMNAKSIRIRCLPNLRKATSIEFDVDLPRNTCGSSFGVHSCTSLSPLLRGLSSQSGLQRASGSQVFLSDDRTPDQTKICADVQSSSSRCACQTCGERRNDRHFSFKQTSARNGDDTTALLDLWQKNDSNLHSCLLMQMIHPAPEGWRSRRQEVLSNRSLARRQCVT